MRKDKQQFFEKRNSGFSLITVMVSVSFIAIMGLLVLYLSLNNFQMKHTDIKGKDSFYTAEQALEEIRLGLQQDVGDAMSRAYIKVMETYNRDSSADAVLDEVRQQDFEAEFLAQIQKLLRGGEDDNSPTLKKGYYSLSHLKTYLDLPHNSAFDPEKETLLVTTPASSGGYSREPLMEVTTTAQATSRNLTAGILLRNLKVVYVDPQGLASVIETDIALGIPKVQFPTPSTLPDLMNMIIVANGGIICQGKKGAQTTISGSIYAGTITGETALAKEPDTSLWLQPDADLAITAGDKVVTENEIRADKGSSFAARTGVNLWTKGLRLSSASVQLLGTTYFADDLTVERGTGSAVTIQGEYYGYGYPTTARADSSRNKNRYDKLSDADVSSAIIVNGRDTTLDLSGVQKMLLAGRSYVSSSAYSSANRQNADVMTGDSITVKGTQLAYLVPSALLKTAGVTAGNPMSYQEYQNSGLSGKDETDMVYWDEPVSAWGGQILREIGVDSAKPIQTVFYNDNGGYVYFYLNFTDDQAASDFMQQYYGQNASQKAKMDRYLSFYFGENAGVTVKDPDSYLRYVTNGNVLTYDGNHAEGNLLDATDAAGSDKLTQEEINLQNSWYALNRKMITSADLLNGAVDEGNGRSHDETDESRSVFDNLVNEAQMKKFLSDREPVSRVYTFTASADNGGLQAMFCDNSQTLNINQAMADKLRLVITTGDVEIGENVQFKGIIMAKGRITLCAGAQLESAPLEAARVFQGVMTDQDATVSPRDFFWEGDKYVLGNSTSAGDDSQNADVYDLADYVSYKNWRKE